MRGHPVMVRCGSSEHSDGTSTHLVGASTAGWLTGASTWAGVRRPADEERGSRAGHCSGRWWDDNCRALGRWVNGVTPLCTQ
jgi:hypothetical protein